MPSSGLGAWGLGLCGRTEWRHPTFLLFASSQRLLIKLVYSAGCGTCRRGGGKNKLKWRFCQLFSRTDFARIFFRGCDKVVSCWHASHS